MSEIVSERAAQGAGVWESDAPDGYVGLVAYDAAGRLLMRLDILADAYRPEILPPLEAWVRSHDPKRIRILP